MRKLAALKIGEMAKTARHRLGNKIGLLPWRIIRLVAIDKYLGIGADETVYMFGKEIGEKLPVKTVKDFIKIMKDMNIGIPKIISQSDRKIIIDVFECATCSGIPNVGKAVCHFEGGIIGGALEKILKKKVNVIETKCWGLGDKVCRFEALIV